MDGTMTSAHDSETVRLGDLALVRSGDKGNHANLGVVCQEAWHYAWLVQYLTCEHVHEYFRELGVDRVERFELPNVQALNFVLYNALAGGASRSLRIDTQGKLLGTAAVEMPLPRPIALGSSSDARVPPQSKGHPT
jgi:hypothetical protein